MAELYYNGSDSDESQESTDSDGASNLHGLLDLEASEASSGSESNDDQTSQDGSYLESFPKFMELPAEIREMVWNAFCPDLAPDPRVFELSLILSGPPRSSSGDEILPVVRGIQPGPQLEGQTQAMRVLMAVHREARALGLRSAPDVFCMSSGENVRYHEERDVLVVPWPCEEQIRMIALRFQELGISAHNLAFSSVLLTLPGDRFVDFVYLLPNMKRLFFLDDVEELHVLGQRTRDYAWAVSEKVHHYHIETYEDGDYGLKVPVDRIYCWPDLDNHREFAHQAVEKTDDNQWWYGIVEKCRRLLADPLATSRELRATDLSDEEKTEAMDRLKGLEVWPMIRFSFEEGLQQFMDMKMWDRPWDEWSSVFSEAQDSHLDEYESYGIDDEPTWMDELSMEDEDFLAEENYGNGSSHLYAFSSASSEVLENTSDIDDLPRANFSTDDEVGHREEQDTGTSESDDEGGPQIRATQPKRQAVLVESGSELSGPEIGKPRRPTRRHVRAVLSESEDDDNAGSSDVEPARGTNRRVRPVVADSEDEPDDDDTPQRYPAGRRRGGAVTIDSASSSSSSDEEVQQASDAKKRRGRVQQVASDQADEDCESDFQGGGAKTRVNVASSSDEEEQGSSDEEDDDAPQPKRMSLANRLRMESRHARTRRPLGEESEAEDVDGGGYGSSDEQDDDAGESDDDGMGMVLETAEEYEDEEGESEEEY